MLLFTGILYSCTYSLRFPHYIFTPYILVRLLLIPLSMIFLGAVILQIIDCFAGIRAPADPLRKIGKIITITFLIFHLIVVSARYPMALLRLFSMSWPSQPEKYIR